MLEKDIKDWVGECLRKKPLSDDEAERIIRRAKKQKRTLYKYYCRHCQNVHLSKLPGRYEDLKKSA
jgi:hypothetical protein